MTTGKWKDGALGGSREAKTCPAQPQMLWQYIVHIALQIQAHLDNMTLGNVTTQSFQVLNSFINMTIHPRVYDMLKPLFYHIMEVIKVAKTHIILEVFVYLYVPPSLCIYVMLHRGPKVLYIT